MTDRDALRTIHAEPTGQVRLVEFERRFLDVMTSHFGSRFLQYREDWARTSRFEFRPDFPLSLDLEINDSCNLRCVMCVMGARPSTASGSTLFMGLARYRRLMDQAREHRLPAMTFGYLSEPLLHPDLPMMIRLAREAGVMDIRLGTNAQILTGTVSQNLITAGLTRLEISLDAVRPETYARIRRGGRLETVIANIESFLELRARAGVDLPLLRLSFLQLPQNDGELDEFLESWRDRADLFSIQDPIYFDHTPLMARMEEVPGPEPRDFPCPQPWQRLVVRADTRVYPCCSPYGLDLELGRVAESTVVDLWSGPAQTELRDLLEAGRYREIPACRICAARQTSRFRPRDEAAKEVTP